MHFLKKTLIFGYIGILFIGTVGVRVFEHVCAINGIDRHLFVDEVDNCSVKKDVKSCCASVKPKFSTSNDAQSLTKKPCCETQNLFYKIQESVTEQHSISVQSVQSIPVLFSSIFNFFGENKFIEKREAKVPVPKLPFSISTKEFLQLTQVYRI